MFPVVSAATVVPVLYVGLVGHSSLTALLWATSFLGIGGTAFAVGIPFVSPWFPPERRGLAIHVFGMSMGAVLYAVAFGDYVAFSVRLPTYPTIRRPATASRTP
jgi:nitrate/nitrite transporter NarK